MEAWLNQVAPPYRTSFSLLGYVLVFLAGIVTSIGPCNLSMAPIIIAYAGGMEAGRRRSLALSVAFTLGTATTFMLLGLFIAAVGGIFGATLLFVYALGRGIPIVLVGTFTGLITHMECFEKWNNIIEKAAGIIIIIMGGYFAYIA